MSSKIDKVFYDIGRLDLLASMDTPAHRLDPRAKVLVTIAFILCVVSFDRYEITRLLPFFFYPAVMIGLGNLPIGYLLKKLLLVSPFVLFIGIFNPWLDRTVIIQVGPMAISGGWLSFISILLRFTLSVGAALLLIATTGFPAICLALNKLGAPRIFTVQLLFLYRYLFVLIEESIRMLRAHSLRSFRKGLHFSTLKQLLGNLLLRTMHRAHRIHLAMQSRLFTGKIHLVQQYHFGRNELIFTLGMFMTFTLLRLFNLQELLGKLLLGLFS
jgi:cobalt/nickel transport system permease protein